MENKIKKLIEVADFLGDTGNKSLLEKWLLMYKANEWTLPFIGRFSAGKSTLLNALLKKRILPTARVETTAALTRIKYATEPSASIIYADKTVKVIPVGEIAELNHQKMDEDLKEIDYIEIDYPAEVLRNGLILMDSPGMDTVINKHVALAEYIMHEAIMVVYVMAGSPSEFDMAIIRRLQQNGVELVVVRTHLDDIKEEEESFINVVLNDEATLANLESPVKYFPLSSLSTAPLAAKEEFERFKNYLGNEIVENLRDVYCRNLSKRLEKISDGYKKTLNERKTLILSQANKSDAEIDEEISEVKRAMKSLESNIESLQKKIDSEKIIVKSDIEDDINDLCKVAYDSFKKSVVGFYTDSGSDASDHTKEFFQKSMAALSQEISDSITTIVSGWAAKETKEVENDFSEFAQLLNGYDIHFDPEFNLDRVNDIALQQEALVDRINELSTYAAELEALTDEQLNNLGIQKDSLQETIRQLNDAHAEAVEVIGNLNDNYQPRYIEKPSKMGEVMKKIGLAGDIAMLLIPAVGWEKGAAMLSGKAAALAAKGGKVAQASSKVLQGAANVTKVLAMTDTAKDMATLLDFGSKSLSQKKLEASKNALVRVTGKLEPIVSPDNTSSGTPIELEKKPSLFDYLSLSYWFGKFGEMIDPPTTEIDLEYEHRYREAKNACEQRAFMIARRRLDEERELGRVKNEMEAKEKEKKLRQDALVREQAQCEKTLKKLSKAKDEAIKNAYADAWSAEFKKEVENLQRYITRQLGALLCTVAQQILAAASYSAFMQLETAKETLEAIKQKKVDTRSELLNPLEKINSLCDLIS